MNAIPRRLGWFKPQRLSFHSASLLPFLHLLAPEEPNCPSVMKKCELALNVAFPWPESVKVAETKSVLAPVSPAPSHIICTLWKMLSLWVDYLLTSFTAMWGSGGTDSLSEGSEAETHIISTDTM